MQFMRRDEPKVSGYSLLIGPTRQRITPFFKEPSFISYAL